jgi:hypothetical protein
MDFLFNVPAFFSPVTDNEDPVEHDGAPKGKESNPYGFCVVV